LGLARLAPQPLDAFKDVYGFVAGDDANALRAMMMAKWWMRWVRKLISLAAGGDNSCGSPPTIAALRIKQRVKERFAAEIQSHYNFIDRQQVSCRLPSDGGMRKCHS